MIVSQSIIFCARMLLCLFPREIEVLIRSGFTPRPKAVPFPRVRAFLDILQYMHVYIVYSRSASDESVWDAVGGSCSVRQHIALPWPIALAYMHRLPREQIFLFMNVVATK